MNIVITGSIAYDYLMSFPGRFSDHLLADHLQSLSVSFLVDSMKRLRGGVAPNIAYTNALLGGRPKIVATAGRDFDNYRIWLEAHNIDTSGVRIIDEEYCASFFVNTDQDHNQIATFYAGAMSHASQLSLKQQVGSADMVIISPNDPEAMKAYVKECQQFDIPYIYDPSQQIIRLEGQELVSGITGCFLLTVNEYELKMVSEKTGLSEQDIYQLSGGLLVTKGKNGSLLLVNGQKFEIPAVPPNKIVEPTGSGDAFRGGLLRGIQLGLPLEVAGQIGSLAATYVLEHYGTQGHNYSKEEFVARYQAFFGDYGADRLLSS